MDGYTANERWYLALTALWADRIRTGVNCDVHPRATRSDVRFAADVLALRPGACVLDVACAWGRTTLELARQGYCPTGFDLSPDLLTLAHELSMAARFDIPFVQGTVRCLPDLGPFDAVTAFYDDSVLSFEAEADNLRALRRIARSLRSGGGFLFGTTDCPLLIAPFQRIERQESGQHIVEEIRFDARTRVGVSVRTHHLADGRVEVYHRVRRHFTVDEAAGLLRRAGLTLAGAWCGYDHALPYGSRAEGMVLLAIKGADLGHCGARPCCS